MHASKWPFPTRPATNTLIQVMLAMGVGFLLVTFPGPVLIVGACIIAFFGGRGLIRELRREWFPPKPDWVVINEKGQQKLSDTPEGKLWQIVGVKNECPDCHGHGFFEGPSGGMSTNIICMNAACRSKFNITAFGGGHGTVDRIGRDPISALDSYPKASFGDKDMTDDQLAAAKAKIIADETPKPEGDPTVRKSRPGDGPDVAHAAHCNYPQEGCICRAWETGPLG